MRMLIFTALIVSSVSCGREKLVYPEFPPPTIINLTSTSDTIVPGGIAIITSDLKDSTKGYEQFEWEADGGRLVPSSLFATWFAPEEFGTYTIRLQAIDTVGNHWSGSVNLEVYDPYPGNQDPIIDSIWVHQRQYIVPLYDTATVTCLASDPDGDTLLYEWTAPHGKFIGEGQKVKWTHQIDSTQRFSIVCTAKDGKGGESFRSVFVLARSW